jgi:hypothetical protein
MMNGNPTKAFVTLGTGEYLGLLDMSSISFKKFCELWGYEYFEIRETLDKSRPDAWSKLIAVRQLLEKFDFVMYVDSDAVILNFDTDLEGLIPLEDDFAWALCPTINGNVAPNAGVMAFRNSERSKKMIDLAYSQVDLVFNGWWEQAALMRVLKYDDARKGEAPWESFNLPDIGVRVCEISSKWNSTIFDLSGDTIIRHFAGDPLKVKIMLMSDYLLRNKALFTKLEKDVAAKIMENYVTAKLDYVRSSQSVWSRLRLAVLVLLFKLKMIRQIKWR